MNIHSHCEQCGGTGANDMGALENGSRPWGQPEPCPECGGTGELDCALIHEDCPDCGATGRYRSGAQCESCLDLLRRDALARCGEHLDGCRCQDCALVDAIRAARDESRRDLQ